MTTFADRDKKHCNLTICVDKELVQAGFKVRVFPILVANPVNERRGLVTAAQCVWCMMAHGANKSKRPIVDTDVQTHYTDTYNL